MPLPNEWQRQPGTDWAGFLRTSFRSMYQSPSGAGSKDFVPFTNLSCLHWQHDEFYVVPGGTQDYSAAGTPTALVVADGTGGQVEYKLATTDEIELYGVANSNNLPIRMNRPWLQMARIQIPVAITTAQLFKVGVASSLSGLALGDPTNATRFAYLALDASMVLRMQVDDNDLLDQDDATARTLAAATFYWFMTGVEEGGNQKFWLADAFGEQLGLLGTYSPVYGANNAQPVVLVGKSGGVTQPSFIIDDLLMWGTRV